MVFPELCDYINEKIAPKQEFIPFRGSYLIKMDFKDGEYITACPMLGESGCVLGDKKPFDCRIWPFRPMERDGRTVITISPLCPSLSSKPAGELKAFLDEGLGTLIFKTAAEHPEIIKPYIEGYEVVLEK